MTLIACSHDGHIVGFNFSPTDLGTVMSAADRARIFKRLYGQTSGVAVADKPVLIENAELLRLNAETDALGEFGESYAAEMTTVTGTPIKGRVIHTFLIFLS